MPAHIARGDLGHCERLAAAIEDDADALARAGLPDASNKPVEETIACCKRLVEGKALLAPTIQWLCRLAEAESLPALTSLARSRTSRRRFGAAGAVRQSEELRASEVAGLSRRADQRTLELHDSAIPVSLGAVRSAVRALPRCPNDGGTGRAEAVGAAHFEPALNRTETSAS